MAQAPQTLGEAGPFNAGIVGLSLPPEAHGERPDALWEALRNACVAHETAPSGPLSPWPLSHSRAVAPGSQVTAVPLLPSPAIGSPCGFSEHGSPRLSHQQVYPEGLGVAEAQQSKLQFYWKCLFWEAHSLNLNAVPW